MQKFISYIKFRGWTISQHYSLKLSDNGPELKSQLTTTAYKLVCSGQTLKLVNWLSFFNILQYSF